jgi:hypothetical protein
MSRTIDDRERLLLDLVKADYEATHRALAGFVASGGQIRAIGIAVWGVLFAAALQTESSAIAALAIGLAIAFAIADGYYSTLYRDTLVRSRAIESLIGDYANSLGIHADSKRKVELAIAAMEQHRFGVHREMRPVNATPRWYLPRPFRVTWIYAVLLLVAATFLGVFAVRDKDVTCTNGRSGAQPCLVLQEPTPAPTPSASKNP